MTSTQPTGDAVYQFAVISLKMNQLQTETQKQKYEDNFSDDDNTLQFNFNGLKNRFVAELTAQYPKLKPADIQQLAQSLVDIARGFDDQFQALAALGLNANSFSAGDITLMVNTCLSKDATTGLPVRQANVAVAAGGFLNVLNNKITNFFRNSSDHTISTLYDLYQNGALGNSLLDVAKFYGLNKNSITPELVDNPRLLQNIFFYFNDHPDLTFGYRQSFLEVAGELSASKEFDALFERANKKGQWDEVLRFVDQMTLLKIHTPKTYDATFSVLSNHPECFADLLNFEGSGSETASSLISWLTDWTANYAAAGSPEAAVHQDERDEEEFVASEEDMHSMIVNGRRADSPATSLEELLYEELLSEDDKNTRFQRGTALGVPRRLLNE